MINLEEIEKLAELARIKLTEEEKKNLKSELEAILNYFTKLQELNLEDGAEFFTTPNLNKLRNDEKISKEENSEILLKQAPETKNGYLKIKKIL